MKKYTIGLITGTLLGASAMMAKYPETGAALLPAVNERLDKTYEDRGQNMPRIALPIVAVLIVPLLTVGVRKIILQGAL